MSKQNPTLRVWEDGTREDLTLHLQPNGNGMSTR